MRLPKVETAGRRRRRHVAALGYARSRSAALIETARGVEDVAAIAAHPAVTSIGLGEADLASDLGSADDDVLDWARVRLLVAARVRTASRRR